MSIHTEPPAPVLSPVSALALASSPSGSPAILSVVPLTDILDPDHWAPKASGGDGDNDGSRCGPGTEGGHSAQCGHCSGDHC